MLIKSVMASFKYALVDLVTGGKGAISLNSTTVSLSVLDFDSIKVVPFSQTFPNSNFLKIVLIDALTGEMFSTFSINVTASEAVGHGYCEYDMEDYMMNKHIQIGKYVNVFVSSVSQGPAGFVQSTQVIGNTGRTGWTGSQGSTGFTGAIGGTSSFRQRIVTINSNGQYNPSSNVIYAIVEIFGGGGCGGAAERGTTPGNRTASGAGGAGGYARGYITGSQLQAAKPINVVIGPAGSSTSGAGGTGGTTTFGSFLTATGGAGGSASLTSDNTSAVVAGGLGGTSSGTGVCLLMDGQPGSSGYRISSSSTLGGYNVSGASSKSYIYSLNSYWNVLNSSQTAPALQGPGCGGVGLCFAPQVVQSGGVQQGSVGTAGSCIITEIL